MRIWASLWAFLLLGYGLFGRAFAYVGVPALKVFIGELALGCFLLVRGGRVISTWRAWLLGGGGWTRLGWSLVLFLIYGLFQVSRGIAVGHEPLVAFQNLVFNAYPLYIFLGFQVAHSRPTLLRRAISWLAWLNALYGIAYLLELNRFNLYFPWAPDVTVFGQPVATDLVIIGLLTLEKPSLKLGLIILINLVVILGIQVRGEWLSLAIGLLVWALLLKRVGRLALVSVVAFLLFASLHAADVRVPGPRHRGGELSARGVVARALALFNPEAAAELIGEEAYRFAGAVTGWRFPWWSQIISAVHSDLTTTFFGLGYGYPLWRLFWAIPEGVRTPHNVFLYALGYGGWIGVGLFLFFLSSLGATLYRCWLFAKKPEAALGFILCIALSFAALFGNLFEAPFGAIPFYLLAGFGLAFKEVHDARSPIARRLPATRW